MDSEKRIVALTLIVFLRVSASWRKLSNSFILTRVVKGIKVGVYKGCQ